MNGLAVLLTEDEKGLIGNELEKLYSFQDRPLSKDKRIHLISEIASHGYPFGAVIQGIRAMFSDELKRITLSDILQSCRENIYHEATQKTNCIHCWEQGVVILTNGNYEKLFSCICGNADKWINHHLAKWNGDSVQLRNGIEFRVAERFLN